MVEQRVEHRAAGPARQRVGGIAVQAVFANIEVERRQLAGAEIVQRDPQIVEFEIVDAPANMAVEFPQPVQHPSFKLGHLGQADPLAIVEPGQVAEQEAQRVADTPVQIGLMFEDFGADAQILGIVGADHPDAQDVGAVLFDDLLRLDRITQRFRHLAAILGHDEPMGEHRVVGRAAARTGRFQQR